MIEDIIKHGQSLFSTRSSLMSMWQDIANNFYVERADFTTTRTAGDDFAAHLMTGTPCLIRRDLGNTLGAMLRPSSKEWAKMGTALGIEDESTAARAWLEAAMKIQRKAMYDRSSLFVRATKEADHDFATFGNCVISIELIRSTMTLLYRCWHLRDVAWCEGVDGKISTVYRKWNMTAKDMQRLFGGKVHRQVNVMASIDPYAKVEVMHCVVPADMYPHKDKQWRYPFVSIYYDCANKHVVETVNIKRMPYVIPRWQTVSGSQYAFSPATIIALPDARMLQDQAQVLIEAGEKAVSPPMLAVQEAIRGDISVMAGGITWVDAEYDERLGSVLRPLTQDKSGYSFGAEMYGATRSAIAEAFFINKIQMPSFQGRDPTAFEVGQQVQEYIRQALPIFEPMEGEYNGGISDLTFEILFDAGAFGPVSSMPKELQGQDIQFKFESPLTEAIERAKGQRFLELKSMLAQGIELDPSMAALPRVEAIMRDVAGGIGTPAKWLNSEMEISQIKDQQEKQARAQQLLAIMQQGANVSKTLSDAGGMI